MDATTKSNDHEPDKPSFVLRLHWATFGDDVVLLSEELAAEIAAAKTAAGVR